MIAKLSREQVERHGNELFRCLKMCEALSVSKCSRTRVLKCRVVSQTWQAAQSAHENLQTTHVHWDRVFHTKRGYLL